MSVVAKARSNGVAHSAVISRPKSATATPYLSFVFRAAAIGDQVPLWSPFPHARDLVLREFWRSEDMLKTAIFSTVTRYAAMEWSIEGPPETRDIAYTMLNRIEDGYGMTKWVQKLWLDQLTQDNGAFTQILRSEDAPDAPCVGLKHLDSERCRRTGSYDQPVIYWDDSHQPHILKNYQVQDFVDFPASENLAYGAGLCATSRILEDARYMRDVAIYQHEKVSGRNPRAIHFIGGVNGRSLRKALEDHKLLSQVNKGSMYIDPPIVPGNDPTATVSKVTLEMASLPDGFDEDKAKRWFYQALANAIGVDSQDLIPLPAGNLGTSQQSNNLSTKGNLRGPALFQADMSHFMNFSGILPSIVRFSYYERDPAFEAMQLDLRTKRGVDRAARIKSEELTPQMARLLAVRDGDLPEEFLSLVGETNTVPYLSSTGVGGNA